MPLQLTKGYLKKRKQRVNANNISELETIFTGVPQVSILKLFKAENQFFKALTSAHF